MVLDPLVQQGVELFLVHHGIHPPLFCSAALLC
jgi:hypothetical protein